MRSRRAGPHIVGTSPRPSGLLAGHLAAIDAANSGDDGDVVRVRFLDVLDHDLSSNVRGEITTP